MKKRTFKFSDPYETVDDLDGSATRDRVYYDRVHRNADGSPARWRINGSVKRWKRDRNRIEIPMKHGLYEHLTITSLEEFNACLAESYEEI